MIRFLTLLFLLLGTITPPLYARQIGYAAEFALKAVLRP